MPSGYFDHLNTAEVVVGVVVLLLVSSNAYSRIVYISSKKMIERNGQKVIKTCDEFLFRAVHRRMSHNPQHLMLNLFVIVL